MISLKFRKTFSVLVKFFNIILNLTMERFKMNDVILLINIRGVFVFWSSVTDGNVLLVFFSCRVVSTWFHCLQKKM